MISSRIIHIRKIKNREMEVHDLRSAHVSCLYYLYTAKSITAAELCERCEEDKATVSRALDYLEQRESLAPRIKDAKRYKTALTLTEQGLAVGKEIAEKINGVLQRISGGLTEAQRVEFYRSLAVISSSLDAVAEGEEPL